MGPKTKDRLSFAPVSIVAGSSLAVGLGKLVMGAHSLISQAYAEQILKMFPRAMLGIIDVAIGIMLILLGTLLVRRKDWARRLLVYAVLLLASFELGRELGASYNDQSWQASELASALILATWLSFVGYLGSQAGTRRYTDRESVSL